MLIYLQMIETEEDKSKFVQIYEEYRGLMYHVAFKRLQHEQDAEDAVHHAFMKIAENIQNIEPVSNRTKQLVVTIVNNRITDLFRVKGKVQIDEYSDDLWYGEKSDSEEENLLIECIGKLPDQQRDVIWLKYYYGYTLREISKMLGISLSSAQKIDQRAKKKLEAMYTERAFL